LTEYSNLLEVKTEEMEMMEMAAAADGNDREGGSRRRR
jgi:hypothetical protein